MGIASIAPITRQIQKSKDMTKLIIISNLTVLPNKGKIELGECNLITFTIGNVKKLISEMCNDIAVDRQNLWWKGYILDDEDLPLIKACIDFANPDESLKPNVGELSLFLTLKSNEVVKIDVNAIVNINTSSLGVKSLDKLESYRREINQISKKKMFEASKKMNACDIFLNI